MAPAAKRLHELMEKKHHLKPVLCRARLPVEVAGLGGAWAGPWLLRALLASHPEQVDNILSVAEAWVDAEGVLPDEVPWYGETLVAVTAWDPELLSLDGGVLGPRVSGPASMEQAGITARITLPSSDFPDPAGRLADFLRDKHAPVTVSRNGKVTRLVPAGKSLKKRLLSKGTCTNGGDSHRMELVLGSKPLLGEWLSSFGGPLTARKALVEFSF
jgi:hypothetical protein